MCIVLNIKRSTYYYKAKKIKKDNTVEKLVVDIFKESRNNYGTRKIKIKLQEENHQVSRRKISSIMKANGLVSKYTIAQFKPQKDKTNESKVANTLNRNFDQEESLTVIVSDLTYVRVKNKWNYICILIDLFNREIVGFSAGKHKDANLVHRAFASAKVNLSQIKLFHTDRGLEFKNHKIDAVLDVFNIQRSLSHKGCPYDNAVAEATFKVIKTEFINNRVFDSLEQLQLELFDYVNWYNNIRIHGSLGYISPVEYKSMELN